MQNFAKKVLDITNGNGVPVVYDGVGKNTLEGSLECLSIRGMMVSFGNASGPLSDINVPKLIQPKGLYLTRPSMQQYLSTKEEIDEAAKVLFDKVTSGKVKIEIFNEVDEDAYTGLTPITNREYEESEQDRKREIRLLDPKYVDQFVDEYQRLISETII